MSSIEIPMTYIYLLIIGIITVSILTIIMATQQPQYTDSDSTTVFKDITNKIANNYDMRRYGLSTITINNKLYVFSTGFDGPNTLMTWQDGKLVDVTPPELEDVETNAIGAAACDIDEDGEEELYVLTTGGAYGGQKATKDKLYDKQGDTWVDLLEDSRVTNQYSGRSVACTYTPKGYGFFVARYNGPMQLLIQEDGKLIDVAPEYGMDKSTGGRSIVNIPSKNGPSLFIGNERGPNYYFERVEDTYKEVAQQKGIADPYLPARGVTVYDKDKNGVFDLAVSNWEAQHRIYEYNGSKYNNVASSSFSQPSPARNLVSADFNNDGDQELFLNNIASQRESPNRYANSEGKLLDIGDASEPLGLGTGATVTDINNDGVLELILAHGESGRQPLTMYHIPNNKDSIRIQPVWKSGAPARTAYVELEDSSVHAVDGGSAYLSQMEPWVHLGSRNLPLDVSVVFPDGIIVNETITETEMRLSHPQK